MNEYTDHVDRENDFLEEESEALFRRRSFDNLPLFVAILGMIYLWCEFIVS